MKTLHYVCLAFLLFAAHAFAAVTVTSPAAGATVSSPVHYVATATASTCSKGVASMGIYVNNKLVYVVDAASMNYELTLAAGAEHTVVEEWDHCGGATYTTINLTVKSAAPTVGISAKPTSITAGSSSTLTVTATNATQVTMTGTDGSSHTLAATGGTQSVSPTKTTTYTATATGAGGKSHRYRNCDGGTSNGADRQHHRQPNFDHLRQIVHPDRDCHQRHAGDDHRNGWQQLYPCGNRRNTIRQPNQDHDLHRNRHRSRRKDHRHCDRNRWLQRRP